MDEFPRAELREEGGAMRLVSFHVVLLMHWTIGFG